MIKVSSGAEAVPGSSVSDDRLWLEVAARLDPASQTANNVREMYILNCSWTVQRSSLKEYSEDHRQPIYVLRENGCSRIGITPTWTPQHQPSTSAGTANNTGLNAQKNLTSFPRAIRRTWDIDRQRGVTGR